MRFGKLHLIKYNQFEIKKAFFATSIYGYRKKCFWEYNKYQLKK